MPIVFDTPESSTRPLSADDIRQRTAEDPTYYPSRKEADILFDAQKAKPVSTKIGEAAKGVVGGIGSILSLPFKGVKEIYKDPSLTRAIATVPEIVGQAGAGLLELGRSAVHGAENLASLGPGQDENEARERHYQHLISNLAHQRQAEKVSTGQDTVIPGLSAIGKPYEASAELLSLVADPAALGAGLSRKVLTTAARGALEGAARQSLETAANKVARGSIVDRGMSRAGKLVSGAAEAARPALQKAGEVAEAVKTPATAAGVVLGATGAGLGPAAALVGAPRLVSRASKVADVAEKAGQTLSAMGGTRSGMRSTRAAQLMASAEAPEMIRKMAKGLVATKLDKALDLAEDLATSGAHGVGFMTGVGAFNKELPAAARAMSAAAGVGTLAGSESAEEFGGKLGSAAGAGAAGHLMFAPVTRGMRKQAANDFETLRWWMHRDAADQKAFSDRYQDPKEFQAAALRAAALEFLVNGPSKDATVEFRYLPAQMFEQVHGTSARGVAMEQGPLGKPVVHINTDLMTSSTMPHEVFHALGFMPDVVNVGELSTKLFGIQDASGKTVKEGLFTPQQAELLFDQYASKFSDPAMRQTFETERATSPDKARARLTQEVGAELFANMMSGQEGWFLGSIDKGFRGTLDKWLVNEKSGWVSNLQRRVAGKLLGKEDLKTSELLAALRSTPELNAIMRGILRARRYMTSTPEVGTEAGEVGSVIKPTDALKKGNERLAELYKDNDTFKKNPDGSLFMSNGRVVPISEREIKLLQAKRADLMAQALQSAPDADPQALQLKPNGAWEGRYFSDAQLAALDKVDPGILTPSMKDKLRRMNEYLKKGDGTPFRIDYNAALKGKRYSSSISSTTRVGVPLSLHISKAGNFYVNTFDVTGVNRKLAAWQKKRPKWFDDFGGAQGFVEMTARYLKNHEEGKRGLTDLDADPVKAKRLANKINDFLNIRTLATEGANPDRLSGKSDKDTLVRARRFDRINDIQPAAGDRFPVDYELIKQNFSPAPGEPERGTIFEARDAEGRAFKMRFDGYYDISGRKIPAITAIDDVPGGIIAGSSGLIETLDKSGLTYPDQFKGESVSSLESGVLPRGEEADSSKQPAAEAPVADINEKFFSGDLEKAPRQLKSTKILPHAVGDKPIAIIHYSGTPGIKSINPNKMGSGKANPNDLRGGPKSFFFVDGSPLGGDVNLFGTQTAYGAVIDGSRIYDLTKGKDDVLGYYRTINREEADDNLKDAGYWGVRVDTGDKRQVVLLFRPVRVKELGPGKGGKKAVAPSEYYQPPVKETVEEGRFTMVTAAQGGNRKTGVDPAADAADTATLKSELQKLGFEVHDARGVYKGEGEPSIFVFRTSGREAEQIDKLARKYNQMQTLHGDHGQFRAPYMQGPNRGKENWGKQLLYGELQGQEGWTEVLLPDGSVERFTVPDLYSQERTRTRGVKYDLSPRQKRLERRPAAEFKDVPEPSSVEPLDVKAAGETDRAASVLAKETLAKRAQLLPSMEDRVRVKRALALGVPEVMKRLQRELEDPTFDSGREWYLKDVAKMEETTKTLFPETQDLNKMRMFKLMLAVNSPGTPVDQNYRYAAEQFATYLKTGEIRGFSEFRVDQFGSKRQLTAVGPIMASKVEALLTRFGRDEQALYDYLTTTQEKTLISGEKNVAGAFDLGPKVGPFFMNLNGLSTHGTIDVWMTRTWNRYMGTPFREVKNQKTGEVTRELRDTPMDSEWPVIQDSLEAIAAEAEKKTGVKLDAMQVQAILWYYEQELYARMGLTVGSIGFAKAAEKYFEKPVHVLGKDTPIMTQDKPHEVAKKLARKASQEAQPPATVPPT